MNSRSPSLEQLTAYVDGELSAHDRQEVERMLASDPDLRQTVEAHEQLQRMYRSSIPAEPAESTWAGVLDNIRAEIARSRAGRVRTKKALWQRVALTMAATAAAATVALSLLYRPEPPRPPQPPAAATEWPVVGAHEVEIISISGEDMSAVVIGEAPMPTEIVPVSSGDVSLRSIEKAPDADWPDVHMNPDDGTPMILAPLVADDRFRNSPE
ncbi:MAG: hypothetical protein KatS3mg105_2682 [Gemmatales bacterium]|nr:MAG: hypothetical protein KatS3mg105_2682 [Gemmatales bacterium]